MEEVIGVAGIGALVVFALVKAYTARTLTQMQAEASGLVTQERHARQQLEREENLLESAEARLRQLEADRSRLQADGVKIRDNIASARLQLRRLKPHDQHEAGEQDRDAEERTERLETEVERLTERLERLEAVESRLLELMEDKTPTPGPEDREDEDPAASG